MAFQRLHREWREHLTVAERDFLGWFMDNTVCWGRTTLRVTLGQMVSGTHWLRSSCIPERSLRRIITGLKEKGLILVRSLKNVTEFSINLTWNPEDAMLRLPKRMTEGARAETRDMFDADDAASVAETPAKLAEPTGQIGRPNKEEAEKYEATESGASHRDSRASQPSFGLVRQRVRPTVPQPARPVAEPPRVESTRAAISGALDRAKAKIAEKLEGKAKPVTTVTVWRAAWQETYDVPVKPLDQRQMGMLSGLRKRVERGGVVWTDFLYWVVASWPQIMAEKFSWMDRRTPPAYPEVAMLVRFVTDFLDAYAVRLGKERMATSSPEQAEYRKLIATGLSHDAAMIEIGRRRAASERHEELSKEREHVNRMYRVIEAEPKKLEKQRLIPAAGSNPTRTTKPEIKHGDNPFEQENPQVLDFSKLDLKWEE